MFQKFFVISHLLFNLAVGPLLHEQSVANVLPGSFVSFCSVLLFTLAFLPLLLSKPFVKGGSWGHSHYAVENKYLQYVLRLLVSFQSWTDGKNWFENVDS